MGTSYIHSKVAPHPPQSNEGGLRAHFADGKVEVQRIKGTAQVTHPLWELQFPRLCPENCQAHSRCSVIENVGLRVPLRGLPALRLLLRALPSPAPGQGSHLEEVILVDHTAVGQRLEEAVGQGSLAAIGHAVGRAYL